MKKTIYKPNYAKCKCGVHDNAVEPNQSLSVKDMLVMFTKGMDLPEKIGEYDENVNIDEIGYLCTDRLEAVDYLNKVNQRIALQKIHSEKSEKVVAETETNSNVESNV